MEEIISQLNEAQQEAVKCIEGPLLILAGAGSGKTKTITTRLAYLLDEIGIPPENTLTLTFTNKAAKEMQERALKLITPTSFPPLLCTFHKFGLLFLKFHIHKLGRNANFVIIDSNDKKGIIKRLNAAVKDESKLTPALIGNEISHFKNSLIDPSQASRQAELHEEKQIANLYAIYENYLKENNLVDFDDLILLTYRILDEHEDVAIETSKKYQYIMIDEYQDTNELQLQLIFKLSTAHKNICVVGDDDQSIYGWRGANIHNILDFDKHFENTKVIKLEYNYRSTEKILEVANALITHNRSRLGKKLISTKKAGEDISVIESHDENEEADNVAKRIRTLLDAGHMAKEMAVLYRVNALSRALEDGLNRYKIPYKLVGGQRFYDRTEIKDYISYLRALTNPQDDFSIKRIINKPKRGLGKVTLDKLDAAALQKNLSLYEFLSQASTAELTTIIKAKNTKTVQAFVKKIQDVVKLSQDITSEFLEELEETFELREFYKNMPEGHDRLRNIDEFKGLFNHHMNTAADTTLDGFLNEVALESDQDQIEGESIYIMSVHASKGLEFENLFVIGMEDGFFPLNGESTDMEEERRLGYVAFTRAKDKLVVSYAKSRFHFGKREILKRSQFLSEAGLIAGALTLDSTSSFKKGDLCKHKIFGMGRITGVNKVGKQFKLSINFGGTHKDILSNFVEKI